MSITEIERDAIAAELRARAEALAAEYRTPLPEGDAGITEALRRLHELRPRARALHQQFTITPEIEKKIIEPIVTQAVIELEHFIEETPPETVAGAITKLRYLTNEDSPGNIFLNGAEDMLEQVIAVLEREAQS
jgi:hypothetical protein